MPALAQEAWSCRVALAAVLAAALAAAAPATADDPKEFLGLDGSVTPAELEGGAGHDLAPGRITLRAEGDRLFVSIETEPLHVASLCLAAADTVYVLHASAALGAVEYGAWEQPARPSGAGFSWALRNVPTGLEGAARRAAYFSNHGWVATTQELGAPGHVEFVIDRELFAGGPVRLALGLMTETDPEAIRAWPAGVEDGCADPELVAGEVPEELVFAFDSWHEVVPPAPRDE